MAVFIPWGFSPAGTYIWKCGFLALPLSRGPGWSLAGLEPGPARPGGSSCPSFSGVLAGMPSGLRGSLWSLWSLVVLPLNAVLTCPYPRPACSPPLLGWGQKRGRGLGHRGAFPQVPMRRLYQRTKPVTGHDAHLRSSHEERGLGGSDGGRGPRCPRHRRGHESLEPQSEAPWQAPSSCALELGVLPAGMGVDRLQVHCPDKPGLEQGQPGSSHMSGSGKAKESPHFLGAFLQGPDQLLCHGQRGPSLERGESQGLTAGRWVGWGLGRGQ